ncbi:hypothetical protein GFV12_05205 [Desulfurobacterium thermolithotrophum]|uniref:hypothetical protein n=1 Tax=Desulfurobacterium thermolithotrophum TaxID=64160 RepID=UPI0013D13805
MKRTLFVVGLLLFSCGGGGGGQSSLSDNSYKLATLSNPQEVEPLPTATTQTIKSLTAVSESAATTKARSSSSKGFIIELLQRTVNLQPTRAEVSIPCDSGFLAAYVSYKLRDGVSQAQSCSDIESVGITLYNTSGVDCQLEEYVIDGKQSFSMTISGSNLQDPDCLPQKAVVEVSGAVKHLSENGTTDEAYVYDNLKIAYSNVVWSGDEIASAKYSITGGASYYLGSFPLDVSAQIDYHFDLTGSGSETSDSFSGYVKLGCLDGWLKVETTKPLEYSGDSINDGELRISANNGEVVISYTPSGLDIKETIDNQTNTYHYDNSEEIKESLNGIVCVR